MGGATAGGGGATGTVVRGPLVQGRVSPSVPPSILAMLPPLITLHHSAHIPAGLSLPDYP